ncbi:MAG TPA: D-alanyl-D-alanine carboxypeptidase family protein [Verrucomicrobiae bacterium]|nr:D-alanyl-D-alanine carboxypeptidase family protein [Verrucomicrobiae bacterium]
MIRFTAALCALLPLAAFALPQPDAPSLKAKSYVLLDYASQQVLAAKEPDLRVGPASLTKLMTAYIAFDEIQHGRIKPTDQVLISEKAWRQGMDSKESRMFIEVGKRVAVQDLLHGIVIQSGNDASIALAEHLGGAEETFAGLMNAYAKKLGMVNTHFMNATGVPDPQQHTSALDVAKLSAALVRNFPEAYKLFSEKEFVFNKIKQPNRNRLLWRDPTVDGIKTGHTEESGYHLSASALRDGRRLISVVMGMDSEAARAEASLALLNYGFRFFETAPAVAAKQPLVTIRAWNGDATELALGAVSAVAVSIPHGAKDRIKVEAQVNEPVYAPVVEGQPVGTLTVSLDGKVLRREPLVALAALPEGGLVRRLSDGIQMWFQNLR